MIDRKTVIGEQRHVTENITALCRYIGFGVAASCYALFTSDSAFASNFVSENKPVLLIASSFAVLTIFFDYLQFLCGYIVVRKALALPEDECGYDENSYSYKFRFRFFYAKQVALVVSAIALLKSLFSFF